MPVALRGVGVFLLPSPIAIPFSLAMRLTILNPPDPADPHLKVRDCGFPSVVSSLVLIDPNSLMMIDPLGVEVQCGGTWPNVCPMCGRVTVEGIGRQ